MPNEFLENLQGGLAIGDAVTGIFDDLKQAKFDKEFDSHYKAMVNNPNYSPNINNKDFNPKAHHAAKMARFNEQQADQTYKMNQMKIMDARIKQQWDVAREGMDRVGVQVQAKNFNGALAELEKTYEGFNDGSNMVIDKDKKGWKIINPDGSESVPQRYETTEAMVHGMSKLAQGFMKDRETFSNTVWGNYQQIWNHNRDVMANAEYFVRPDGQIGMKYTGFIDTHGPNEGKKIESTFEFGGERLTEEEWKKQKFVPLEVGKIRSDISKEFQATQDAKAGKGKGLTPSTLEKEVTFIQKVMSEGGTKPFTRKQALNMHRSDKLMPERIKALGTFATNEVLDPDDPADAKKLASKQKEIKNFTETELNEFQKKQDEEIKNIEAAKKAKAKPKSAKGLISAPTVAGQTKKAKILSKMKKVTTTDEAKAEIKRLQKEHKLSFEEAHKLVLESLEKNSK
jgi:hypothetical protein